MNESPPRKCKPSRSLPFRSRTPLESRTLRCFRRSWDLPLRKAKRGPPSETLLNRAEDQNVGVRMESGAMRGGSGSSSSVLPPEATHLPRPFDTTVPAGDEGGTIPGVRTPERDDGVWLPPHAGAAVVLLRLDSPGLDPRDVSALSPVSATVSIAPAKRGLIVSPFGLLVALERSPAGKYCSRAKRNRSPRLCASLG